MSDAAHAISACDGGCYTARLDISSFAPDRCSRYWCSWTCLQWTKLTFGHYAGMQSFPTDGSRRRDRRCGGARTYGMSIVVRFCSCRDPAAVLRLIMTHRTFDVILRC